ncbi:MAG: hypothetical protein ABIN48_09500 [Ginsengibacter sp.]
MNIQEVKFEIKVYDSLGELEEEDATLLSRARSVTQFAYAPYSNFRLELMRNW